MAENFNECLSSVFTRKDISALPQQEIKSEGREIINHMEWMGFLPNYYWKL